MPLQLLEEKTTPDATRPAINGWRKKQSDLPTLVTNASDHGGADPRSHLAAHGVAVHPLPKEFVAVAWKSPLAGGVRVAVRVAHAHPACGNGVAWWLEHRRAGRATALAEGLVDLGKEAKPPAKTVKVEKGDMLVLAVDARDGNHSCDLTEIAFTVAEDDKPGRVWDLAADVADTVHAGNPHADKHGNADVWSFVRGASKGGSGSSASRIPPDSVLGRWRKAAADPRRQSEAATLAGQVETLLSGARPTKEKDPDRILYDRLVAMDGPLFQRRGRRPAREAAAEGGELRPGEGAIRPGRTTSRWMTRAWSPGQTPLPRCGCRRPCSPTVSSWSRAGSTPHPATESCSSRC